MTTPAGEGGRREGGVGDKNAPTNGPLDCGYQTTETRRRRNQEGMRRGGNSIDTWDLGCKLGISLKTDSVLGTKSLNTAQNSKHV